MKIIIDKRITQKRLVAQLENNLDLTVVDLQNAINKIISLINRKSTIFKILTE